jgi:hypothetical protein
VLVDILTKARFGSTRSELVTSQIACGASYSVVRACLGYLLSHSLLEEENVEMYRSQFGALSRSTYFTTERGFHFLQTYSALARLAGTLGEAPRSEKLAHVRSSISIP